MAKAQTLMQLVIIRDSYISIFVNVSYMRERALKLFASLIESPAEHNKTEEARELIPLP